MTEKKSSMKSDFKTSTDYSHRVGQLHGEFKHLGHLFGYFSHAADSRSIWNRLHTEQSQANISATSSIIVEVSSLRY